MARKAAGAIDGVLITVAICCAGGREPHHRALESVLLQSLPAASFEVLLVGAGPRAAAPSRVRPIAAPGDDPAAMRNRALAGARAGLIAFLEPDAVAGPDWLAAICAAFEAFGAIVPAVTGRVRPLWGEARPAWLGDGLLPMLSLLDLGDETRFLADGERPADANLAFRTEVATALGGFVAAPGDDRPTTGTARRLLARIAADGGRVAYAPGAAVDYPIPAEWLTQEWFRRRAAWQAVQDVAGSAPPTPEQRAARWQDVKDFFFSCPPADRTIRGLVLDQPDPRGFEAQVMAVYDCLACLLAGAGERDDAG